MRGHCYIHIGAPKTGTTFLQKILFDNRNALAKQEVLYPDVSLRGYGHHDIAFRLSGGYPKWATTQPKSLDVLTEELAESVRDHRGNVVLSSEDFYIFPAAPALYTMLESARVLANREPIIIVYLRRQDAAHESWYNQTIKAQGETHALDECIELNRELFDYHEQLERWSSVFGRSSLVVRPYEEGQLKNGSLVEDFFGVIGIDPHVLAIPPERVNSGLNKDVLEFQRLINHLPLEVERKRLYHRELIALTSQTSGAGLFGETPLLSGPQRRDILAFYSSGNAEVAAKYLDREALFFDEPSDIPEVVAAPELTAQKLAYIFGWLLAQDRNS
jgi:hypothetical protein